MKVYTTFILSATSSITRGVTYAKLTHTVAEGRYTTAPYLFPADPIGFDHGQFLYKFTVFSIHVAFKFNPLGLYQAL